MVAVSRGATRYGAEKEKRGISTWRKHSKDQRLRHPTRTCPLLDGFVAVDVADLTQGSDLDGPTLVACRALLRRALTRGASAAAAGEEPPGPRMLPGPPARRVTDIVGEDHSAAVVAKLVASSNEVDIAKLNREAGLSDLPFHMQADRFIYRIMAAENTAAIASERTPF